MENLEFDLSVRGLAEELAEVFETLVVMGVGGDGVGHPDDDLLGGKGGSGGEQDQADGNKTQKLLHGFIPPCVRIFSVGYGTKLKEQDGLLFSDTAVIPFPQHPASAGVPFVNCPSQHRTM